MITANRIEKFNRGLPKKVAFANKKRKIIFRNLYVFTRQNPFRMLFAVLALFLFLMILGNVFFAPKKEATVNLNNPKVVKTYKIGSAPEVSYQGRIEKSGVVKIVAQTPGIVSAINVSEGSNVSQGTNILSLSTNYSGGNTLSIARQIAGTQFANARNTYNDQKEIIAKQRELADKNKDNADQLQSITAQSATDTQNLANLDQDIVNGIKTNIDNLEASNVGGINDAAILQAKQGLAQFQAALNGATSGYKSLQVQINQSSKDVANLQHDIALKQLDIQEKTLQMTLDLAGLQLRMAQVNEATMFPSSPFSGVVDRVFVRIGDSVNPGTVLAQISGDEEHGQVIVNVPDNIARRISNFEPSTLYFENQTIKMLPTFVTRNATNGTLYSIIYDLGDLAIINLTDSAYIEVHVPIGVANTTNEDPYVPLDAVVQTEQEAFVYVADSKNIARSKKVLLGNIQGRYVEVLRGLPQNAEVILDRNVIDGDKVSTVK